MGGRASNEPEAINAPEAKSLQFGSLPSQESQESALDNRSTRKIKAEETLNGAIGSVGTPLNSDAVGSDGTSPVITMETSATQTDVILPQRVDEYWHCCLLSTTVIDKPRTVAEVSEAGCDNVEPETEAVYYNQGEQATMSASRDPRQRTCDDDRQLMCEEM